MTSQMLGSGGMPMLTLAAAGWPAWLVGLLLVLFVVVCVFMVLTVLIQKPQGGGLAGAFGAGASSGQTAFGTKTGDALTVFTVAVFVIYLVFAVILNLAMKPTVVTGGPAAGPDPAGTTAPAETPAPAPETLPAPAAPAPAAETTAPAGETPAPAGETPAPAEPAPQSDAPPADGAPATPPKG